MPNLNKVRIPIAVNNRTKLDLSCDHLTSMRFMTMQPVFYRHMIKGEHLSFDSIANVRPAPMPVPTYGRCTMNLRGFFVPYRLAFPHWHSYYDDVIASNYGNSSIVGDVPLLSHAVVSSYFLENGSSYLNSVLGTSADYDFSIGGNYYKLTQLGLQRYKIFYSLGYDITGSAKDPTSLNFNALALLCYARIYADWYSNTQYLNSADILKIEQLCSYNDPSGQLVLTEQDLDSIFKVLDAVVYDSNGYFESCWDNPVSPNNGQYSSLSFIDPTGISPTAVTIDTLANGTPYMKQASSNYTNIGTEYIHTALKKLNDYVRRHALAGALNIERVLSQYGIQTDYLKLQRSIYVGCDKVDVNVGEIYATAAGVNGSDSSVVGDYAGRGFGASKKSWDFTCDEEGIFIVIASIVPSGGYYQGYDRNNRHGVDGDGKKSFFVPEFDSLGVQVIEKGEVFVSREDSWTGMDPSAYAVTFGFCGRYGEYKRPISRVSGNLAFPRIMAGGSSWHLMRDVSSDFLNIGVQKHSLQFSRGGDSWQYNRVFNDQFAELDPFFVFFHFDVGSYAPCKPLFETYEFDDEDKSKQIDLRTNGSALN